ncbi:MAG: TrkA family potassium uptake protein [Clostridia bacterium]|nr:TrkA family potassium uptake protein [Clostridia bacterium]
MNKSYAVFGLGRYGLTVVKELIKNGADVLAVDINESVIENAKSSVPICKCADVTNKEVLVQLGIANIDTVVIAMASHLEESIMTTMLCKEMGVKKVIVKSATEFNKKILLKVGADKVVIPEYESGIRMAKEILHSGFVDVVDISNKISMLEIEVQDEWVGKTLMELDLRKKHSFNVVAIKIKEEVVTFIDPSMPLQKDMVLLVIADVSKIKKWNK